MSPLAVRVCILALLGLLGVSLSACKKEPPLAAALLKVAAAADLAVAFEDIGAAFEKKTGTKPVFSFGSTGLLAKQITEGAPFDVFAAANVSFVNNVVREGACDGSTQGLYARGRIVVWTKQSAGSSPATLTDLKDARFARVAIANPEHAPYGQAAKEALQHAGIWEAVSPKLVFGENVRQTLQFAETGNVEAAIVALSLAIVTKGGQYTLIEEGEHAPIDQALVVCRHGKNAEAGRRFTAFVNSEEGRAIMRRYGFVLPGEAPPVTGSN
jgi:molybdate transport system substrate-binding protein